MIKPIFSEKSLLMAKKGKYTFRVPRNFTKFQVKNVVNEIFGVKVDSVVTTNYKGTTRRTIRGTRVTTAPFKKAVVSLKDGAKIDLWESQKKEETKTKVKKAKKATK